MIEVNCPYAKAGCPFQVCAEYNVINCYLFQPSLWRSLVRSPITDSKTRLITVSVDGHFSDL